jgi:alpha-glucoside transport system permease protein
MDLEVEGPKLLMLFYGVVAFLAIVGLLLLGLDRVGARKDRWIALGFLAPAAILLVIGLVIPAIRTFVFSFLNADSSKFVGLENYKWIFTQEDTRRVLLNTALWVALVPTVSTFVGLIYAVLVDRARFEAVAKSLIFMPMAISFVGAGIIWKFVYAYRDPEQGKQTRSAQPGGLWLGGKPQQLAARTAHEHAVPDRGLVWIQAGFAMVVLSAAIKGDPAEITEAARIDGVTPWQMFWRVTVPSIRPALLVVLVTITIGSLKLFDIVRTMTGGRFQTERARAPDVRAGVPTPTTTARARRWPSSSSCSSRRSSSTRCASTASVAGRQCDRDRTPYAATEAAVGTHRDRAGAPPPHEPHRERHLAAHRSPVDGADVRPVHLVVSARGRHQDQRLVELLQRPKLTLKNYNDVLFGTSGTSGQLASFFVNSMVITIPSVLFPLAFCSLAAYALAWTRFRGREWIYVASSRCRSCRCRWRSCRCCSSSTSSSSRAPARSRRSGSRTRASPCRWARSCCTTSWPSCRVTSSRRRVSTARATHASSVRWCCR